MKRLKSFFGIQGLIYLVVGVLLVVFGIQSPEIVDDFNIYWMMTASSFLLGILLFISKKGETAAVFISRIVVGGVFIVSGLIKANDTVGFGFKLEEYFRAVSLGEGWTMWHDHSLTLSILISGAEVLLGLAIMLGAWARVSTTMILIMTVFFAWLTNFTADCVSNQADYTSISRKIASADDAFLTGDFEKGAIAHERMLFKYDRMGSSFRQKLSWSVEPRRTLDVNNPDTSLILRLQKEQNDYTSIQESLNAGDLAFMAGDTASGKVYWENAFSQFDNMPSSFTDDIGKSIEPRRALNILSPDTSLIKAAFKLESLSFYWECVEDCGCFGDALKGSVGRSLTPRESFYKDMFLVFFVLVLFLKQGSIEINNRNEDAIILISTLALVALFGGGLFGWWFPLVFTGIAAIVSILFKKISSPGNKQVIILAVLMAIMSYGFAFYTYTFLPIKDYRPYRIGSLIPDKMLSAEELNAKYNYQGDDRIEGMEYYTNWLWRNVGTGMDTIVVDTSYMSQRLWEDSIFNMRYIAIDYDGDKHVLKTGYETKILDFSMSQLYSELSDEAKLQPAIAEQIEMNYDPGYGEDYYVMQRQSDQKIELVLKTEFKDSLYPTFDSTWVYVKDSMVMLTPANNPSISLTNQMLSSEKMLWVISYDLAKADEKKLEEMKDVMVEAQNQGVKVAFISSAGMETVEKLQDRIGFYFPYYICDATELKIVVRSNPGMVYLEEGVVKGKWDYNRIPEIKDLK